MKEASGELSMTAVAIVAIVAVGAVFTTMIWPAIKNNLKRQTYCSAAYNCVDNGDSKSNCFYVDENNTEQSIVCPNSSLGTK